MMRVQRTERQGQMDRPVGLVALWLGMLAGPLAWTAHLLVFYGLVGVVCATGLGWLIHLTTIVTILVAAAGGFLSYRHLRRPGLTDGARFVSLGGALLSVVFIFAIVLEALPSFAIGPCTNG